MSTVTIEEAQKTLPELIEKLALGEEIVITRDDRPVAQLVGVSAAREWSSDVAAKDLLSQLVTATPGMRRPVRERILQSMDPRVVARIAFQEYDRTGKEAFLLHALSLVDDFGAAAWPALKKIAGARRSECELFLGATARCPGVSPAERLAVLRLLVDSVRSAGLLAWAAVASEVSLVCSESGSGGPSRA